MSGNVWRRVPCGACSGHGMVSAYSMGDFDGAKECDDCGGTGKLSVTPNGRLAMYPGGPFRGSIAAATSEA